MQFKETIVTTVSMLVLIAGLGFGAVAIAEEKQATTAAEEGKAIAFNRKKGNCLACHVMGDGTMPGNVGPPLIAMKARFPDKQKLFDQVWDARTKNPHTIMPPFGTHKILSKSDINKIVEYMYTL